MENIAKSLEEQFPLCAATGSPVANDIEERKLEDSLSIDQKVELKIKAGIEPTVNEAMLCKLPYDLPGEAWVGIPGTSDKMISNKRRVKNSKRIMFVQKGGLIAFEINDKPTQINTCKMVVELFPLNMIHFNEPQQTAVTKFINHAEMTIEDRENFGLTINLPGEVWKPVRGYEEYYMVSNFGRVKNIVFDIIMAPSNDRGYRRIHIRMGGHKESLAVHRMVAEAFIPIDHPEEYEINHIDGNKSNNVVTNLEWCTHQENMVHASKNDLLKSKKIDRYLLLHANDLYQKGMEISDIVKLPEFAEKGITYFGLYKVMFKIRGFYDDIPMPERRSKGRPGKSVKRSSFTPDQIIAMKMMRDKGYGYPTIAKEFNTSLAVVKRAVNVKALKFTEESNPEDYAKAVEYMKNK